MRSKLRRAISQSRSPFILVFVDGNRLPISRQFIAQGSLGGYFVASQVRLTVEKSLWQYGLNLSRFATTRIVLFADLEKLAKACSQGYWAIQDFFTGFDSTHFETTFQEINRTFLSRKDLEVVLTRALCNPSCQHVVFFGQSWEIFKSFGNRLARQGQMDKLQKSLIVPASEAAEDAEASSTVNSDIDNIETRPTTFPRNHGVIMRGVRLIYDPTLYLAFDLKREKRLEDPSFRAWLTGGKLYSTHATDSDSSFAPTDTNVVRSKENPDGTECRHDDTCRTEIEGDKARAGSQLDGTAFWSDQFHSRPRNAIPRNRIGQRVDPPVDFNKELRVKMQKERWCSNYHLKGSCPIRDCRFKHGTLDDDGKNALLSLTRGNFCRNGNRCEEQDCYAGHQCPYNPCNKEETCHFPPEMHVTDKQIVNMEITFSPDSRRQRSNDERRQPEGMG